MTQATKEAVQFIKDAGFTHIKFELEANIGREDGGECYTCEGSGNINCYNCSGEGAISTGNYTRISEDEIFEECSECYGEGYETCNTCDGEGSTEGYYDESSCEEYMRNYVRNRSQEAIDALTYGNFYEDGSVDSEFTFTIPIERILKGDFHLWVRAFRSLAEDECNGELEVHGAGMHITLLRDGDYTSLSALPRLRLANFTREVTKLLPALFFVGSAGHQCRSLNYRQPQISARDKYSAIYTHGGTCIEYRLFETCYDRPDAVFEYIQAIASTLRFYQDTNLTVKELGKQFGFADNAGSIASLFNTPEQLRILNATIKEIKPKDKSFKKLKEDRGVKYTIKSLTLEEKKRMARLRKEWYKYYDNYRKVLNEPLTPEQQREYDLQITNYEMSPDGARLRAKGLERIGSFEDWVERQMRNLTHRDVVLTV